MLRRLIHHNAQAERFSERGKPYKLPPGYPSTGDKDTDRLIALSLKAGCISVTKIADGTPQPEQPALFDDCA